MTEITRIICSTEGNPKDYILPSKTAVLEGNKIKFIKEYRCIDGEVKQIDKGFFLLPVLKMNSNSKVEWVGYVNNRTGTNVRVCISDKFPVVGKNSMVNVVKKLSSTKCEVEAVNVFAKTVTIYGNKCVVSDKYDNTYYIVEHIEKF